MTPEEIARKEQTIVVHCANGHIAITWYSRRDAPVPCPICTITRQLTGGAA
jgi:hypothetical protein